MTDIASIFGTSKGATFLELAAGDLSAPGGAIALLGVPHATPYGATGDYAATAPAAMRKAIARYGAARHHQDFDFGGPLLGSPEVDTRDYGDLATDPARPETNRSTIRSAVAALRAAGAVPVILGGDDSVPIPVLEAYAAEGPIAILQIDAHIDWRDDVGGERLGLSSNMRRASEMAHVAAITQIGARAIGSARPSDAADARNWGVRFVTAPEIHRHGLERAIEAIPTGRPLFINLDVDALDPSVMPAVIGPAPGGLSFADVARLIEEAAARCPIVGFAAVELFPARDANGLAAFTAARLVCHALARIARQTGA